MRPRLSIHLNNFGQSGIDIGRLVRLAENADAAGIDRVVVSDHVVFGNDLEAYADPRIGGIEGGKQPTGPDGWWLEPLAVLTYVAARTQNIRLGTSILLAALRRPIVLAKQLSTIDVMSNGRLDIGVGVGWQREEYTASDLDFAGRGGHLDRTLGALRAAWSGSMDWDGLAGSAEIHQYPQPAQIGKDGVPRIPLWIAGTSKARTIEIGDLGSDGRQVLLCRVDGKVHALDTECPHGKGGRLIRGPLHEGRFAVCPLHNYKFDATTGRPKEVVCSDAKTYTCVERNGQIEVHL